MGAKSRIRQRKHLGAFLALGLIVSGCSMFSGITPIHKSTRGTVYLKEVSDWSFEAGHPVILDQATILKVFKGIVGNKELRMSGKVPASGSKPMRIFSDDDAEFLAPLLAQALSQARPEHVVGFTASPSAGSGAEPAAGTLYVQHGSIHVTVVSSLSTTPSGFIPTAVARIEKTPSFARRSTGGALSLAIDYQELAKSSTTQDLPVASDINPQVTPPASLSSSVQASPRPDKLQVSSAGTAGSPGSFVPLSSEMSNDELLNRKLDELQAMRESNKMKEAEINTLRKEVDRLKEELRKRTAEVKAMKASRLPRSAGPKKKASTSRPLR